MNPAGKWIGMTEEWRGSAAPLLRRDFPLPQTCASAHLRICGLGYYEAWINGQRVGDHVLDPAQTDYESRCLFATYDVTAHLRLGTNAIGVILGDGFFNQGLIPANYGWKGKDGSYGSPCLWAELAIVLQDGTRQVLTTDENWKCSTGPVLSSNVYAGERYDARREQSGWDKPEFRDDAWHPVTLVPGPGGSLEEQRMPPIKKIEEIRPVAITQPQPGCHVLDLGQNFAGWARIRVQAPAGCEIRLRFAEALTADGRVDTASTGVFATKVEQIDTYTCRGQGVETWEPRFTYHGFRYVEVTGWPGTPSPDDITGIVVHTALPPAGSFECSDARLNRLHGMAVWTLRSNIHGIPEDCPARERCGWLGDANANCEYTIYNFQSLAFWEKYLGDIETTRALNGGLPSFIAPGKRCTREPAAPDWIAAFIQVPWYLYVYYGQRRPLERHWEGMRAVLEHFGKKSDKWVLAGGLGDWCDPGGACAPTYTPEAVTTTMWFWRCAWIMARAAHALGRSEDAARYDAWAVQIRAAFQARFYDRAHHTFGSQTADAMALRLGLVPPGEEADVGNSLEQSIRERHHLHHMVGIVGLRFLFEALTQCGHGDTALALMHQDTPPSFGDLIGRGATTLWEYWGEPEVEKAEGPRSLNHPMMGGFDNWFYHTLAGIRPDWEYPGFTHFFLEPHPIPGIDWVRAHHDSPHGRIVSHWQSDDQGFAWQVVVPPGSTATATLPYARQVRTLEPGTHQLSDQPALQIV
jgi:alpha-L-rhamnosidase